MRYRIIFLILLSFLIISCSDKPDTYTVETVDGVRHVHNTAPLWGSDERISLEFVRKIGELESEDDNMMFHQPCYVVMDKEDNIYISDRGNHRIVKTDSKGDFILAFGNRGDGPGEFSYPGCIQIDSTGNLHVCDLRGIQIFNPEGEYIKSNRLPNVMSFKFIQNDLITVTDMIFRGSEYSDYFKQIETIPLVRIIDQTGNLINEFGKRRIYDDRWMRRLGNNFLLAVDFDNNFYLAFSNRNVIEKYSSDGNLLVKSSRELGFEESTEAVIVRANDRGGNLMPMHSRFSKSINIDGKNRMWIETYRRRMTIEERGEFNKVKIDDLISVEVYNDNGILLQRIPWEYGHLREISYIKNDRLFCIDRSDMCIYEYKIIG
ncbi:6-bladed beta-propeller [candidate division KSB1 bacterium]